MAQVEIYKIKKTVPPEVKEYGMFEFFGMVKGPLPQNYVREWDGELPGGNNLDMICGKFFLNPPEGYRSGPLEKSDIAVVDGTAYFLDRDSGYRFVEVEGFDTTNIKNALHVEYGSYISEEDAVSIPRTFAIVCESLDIPVGYFSEPGYHGSSKGISDFERSTRDNYAQCYLHPHFLKGEEARAFVSLLKELSETEQWGQIAGYLRECYPVYMKDLEEAREIYAPELLFPEVLRPLVTHPLYKNTFMDADKSELAYLTVKIEGMKVKQRKVFDAAVEAGLCNNSVAGIINLTENLACYKLHPELNEAMYGHHRIEHDWSISLEAYNHLNLSSDPAGRALIKYITLLNRAADTEAYGRHAAKEDGAVFTSHGLISEESKPREVYHGIQDLPDEYRLFTTESFHVSKDRFWQMIEDAREKVGGWQGMCTPLIEALEKLDEPDIIRFKQIFNEYWDLAYKENIWAVAALINDGCTGDGFMDFRAWLIAQGKEVYLNALADPDSLADVEAVRVYAHEVKESTYAIPSNKYYNAADFEALAYAANDAYKSKTGGDMYGRLNNNPLTQQEKADIAGDVVYAADMDTKWGTSFLSRKEIKTEMERLTPNLAKMFYDGVFPEIISEAAPSNNRANTPKRPTGKESVLAEIAEARKTQGKAPKTHKPPVPGKKKPNLEL